MPDQFLALKSEEWEVEWETQEKALAHLQYAFEPLHLALKKDRFYPNLPRAATSGNDKGVPARCKSIGTFLAE